MKYKTSTKTQQTSKKLDLEGLYNNIATKLWADSRPPYVPSEGLATKVKKQEKDKRKREKERKLIRCKGYKCSLGNVERDRESTRRGFASRIREIAQVGIFRQEIRRKGTKNIVILINYNNNNIIQYNLEK